MLNYYLRSLFKYLLVLNIVFITCMYADDVNVRVCSFNNTTIKVNDRIEKILLNDLRTLNPYFDTVSIVHVLKMYNEYDSNKKVYKLIPKLKYRIYVLDYCTRYAFDCRIAYAIIQWESGWNEKAIGRNKTSIDISLGQINSMYALAHAENYFKSEPLYAFDVYNWRHNLEVSLGYMLDLYKYFDGDHSKLMMAYNCGIYYVAVNRPPKSARTYVKCVSRILYSI